MTSLDNAARLQCAPSARSSLLYTIQMKPT